MYFTSVQRVFCCALILPSLYHILLLLLLYACRLSLWNSKYSRFLTTIWPHPPHIHSFSGFLRSHAATMVYRRSLSTSKWLLYLWCVSTCMCVCASQHHAGAVRVMKGHDHLQKNLFVCPGQMLFVTYKNLRQPDWLIAEYYAMLATMELKFQHHPKALLTYFLLVSHCDRKSM